MNNINRLIMSAFRLYPFYKNLYRNLKCINYEEVPIVKKWDLLKFSRYSGKPFYYCPGNKQDYCHYFETSGTSGMRLTLPFVKGAEHFLDGFQTAIKHLNERYSVCPKRVLYPQWSNQTVDYLLHQAACYFPFSCSIASNDLSNLSNILKINLIDTIFDITNQIPRLFVKRNYSTNETGVKLFMVMSLDNMLYEDLRALGYNIVKFYICMEFGVLGFSYNDSSARYMLTTPCLIDRTELVINKKIVLTGQIGEFPLIKYDLADIVSLHEDNFGFYVNLHGRRTTFPWPNDTEENFSYESCYANLIKMDELKEGFIVMGITNSNRAESNNIIVIYVVSNLGSLPQKTKQKIKEKALISGIGGYNNTYKKYIFVQEITCDDYSQFISKKGRIKNFYVLENPLDYDLTETDLYHCFVLGMRE